MRDLSCKSLKIRDDRQLFELMAILLRETFAFFVFISQRFGTWAILRRLLLVDITDHLALFSSGRLLQQATIF